MSKPYPYITLPGGRRVREASTQAPEVVETFLYRWDEEREEAVLEEEPKPRKRVSKKAADE